MVDGVMVVQIPGKIFDRPVSLIVEWRGLDTLS
jgi:hypothetical protein